MIAIPDDDEKSPSVEQEKKKNGEEPMETDKQSNGEMEGVKGEKMEEGEGEKKSPEGGEETKVPSEAKMVGSDVRPEDAEVKGKSSYSEFFLFIIWFVFSCIFLVQKY